MNEYNQAMECDDCRGGGSSDAALVALFGFLLVLGGSSWWALNVLVREARFWPFAATVGTFAWFLLDGGRNKFPVLGWLLVGLVAATFYFLMSDKIKSRSNQAPKPLPTAKTTTKQSPSLSSPDHVVKCNSCGASLLTTEHVLCAECRIQDRSIAPGIAEHIAKSNVANVERADRITPSEAKAAPISTSLTSHASLLATVRALQGVVIITVQQYENGPWWSRAFRSKDVATAYLKLGLPLPPSRDGAALIAEAKTHDLEIAARLVDAQISPLAEAVADNAQESIDQVTARL